MKLGNDANGVKPRKGRKAKAVKPQLRPSPDWGNRSI